MSLVSLLTPFAVPLIVWGMKKAAASWIGSIPKPLLPILAAVLGAAVDAGAYYTNLKPTLDPTLGTALGAAAVGVREIVDQVKKAATE